MLQGLGAGATSGVVAGRHRRPRGPRRHAGQNTVSRQRLNYKSLGWRTRTHCAANDHMSEPEIPAGRRFDREMITMIIA